MILVVVVADIRLYREGLRDALARLPDIEVAATAATREEARACVRETDPDVVVVDVAMLDADDLLRDVGGGRAALVALTVPEAEEAIVACAEAGVVGYVGRDGSLEQIVDAIRDASRNEVACDPHLAATLVRGIRARARAANVRAPAAADALAGLTRRELEIARLIAFEGLSNKQIAQRLCIELPTVKNHVHNVLAKLSVERRSEAAAVLRELEPVRTV